MVHPQCTGYEIIFSDAAKKDLEKLEQSAIATIIEKTKDLISSHPDNLDIKKLKSKFGLYRLRTGHWRIIYSLEYDKVIVHVIAIGHRKDVYAVLDRRLR